MTGVQTCALPIYERTSVESAIAKARGDIIVSIADAPTPAFSAFRIGYTGSDEKTAVGMVDGMIAQLIQGHAMDLRPALEGVAEARDRALQKEIGELKGRLFILESRLGISEKRPTPAPATAPIVPSPEFSSTWALMMNLAPGDNSMEVLETTSAQKVFPNPVWFSVGGALLGLLLAWPLRRLT